VRLIIFRVPELRGAGGRGCVRIRCCGQSLSQRLLSQLYKKKNRQGITSNSSGFQRISFCYLAVYYIFIDDARKCTIPIDKKNKFI
jgi:hypothetical protein